MADPTGRPAPASAAPPLVGRERELDLLHGALAAALDGRGSLVFISGEAGIGKTTLAEALCDEAVERGALVLVGRCYDLTETPPYGPWHELFVRAAPDDLARVPALFAPAGDLPRATSQDAHFAEVWHTLATMAARRPCLLLLEDLHWADPASLDLLRALARQIGDLSLLLLATYRADDLTRRHPLYQLLPTLVREARTTRIDLHRLERDDLRVVVRRYELPDTEEHRLVAYLVERAEGNPFFVGELLRSLEEDRALRPLAAGWALADLAGVRMPPLLRQVVDARIDRLGDVAREALEVAAVIGQVVPLDLWQAVAGTDEAGLLAVAERAIAAHLLTETANGLGVRFAHALIREALYEGTAALRRRAWHRQAGEALAAAPAPDPDAVAHQFRRAGDARAATWLTKAGERAERARASVSAGERYEAALLLLEGDAARAGERGWLLYRLARVRAPSDARQSLSALHEAARVAATVGDHVLAAAVLEERGSNYNSLMDSRQARAALEASAAAVEGLPPEERVRLNQLVSLSGAASDINRVRGIMVAHRAWEGSFAEALALGEPFVTQAALAVTGLGFNEAIAESVGAAYLGLGVARALLGQPDAAQQAFAEARAAYRAVEDHLSLGDIAGLELRYVALAYHPEQVAVRRRLAAEVAEEFGRAGGTGWTMPRLFCLPLLLLEGRWDEARTLAREGRIGANNEGARKAALGWWGLLAREQGEPDLAAAQLRDALPAGPATVPNDGGVEVPRLQLLGAALASDAGDLATARAWLTAHDRWLARSGAVLGRAEGQLASAAYQRAAGDGALARELGEQALTHATAPRQPLALLQARRFLGELATAERRHADAATHLDAALALAESCAAPYERALTLLAQAELHVAAGDHAAATTTLDEARPILVPLKAAPALARAAALEAGLLAASPAAAPSAPFGLTAREVEVLRLVAEGLTNAEVAARLFVTPRTVNGHLTAIYTKLNVTTRTAAARIAAAHGLR